MFKLSRPIPKVKAAPLGKRLPEYGLLYFDHLNAEIRSQHSEAVTPTQQKTLEEIQKKREDDYLTWNDLYTFDLILVRLLPKERLSRKAWSLRSRYRDVAGLREYEAYLASKPPDLASQTEENQLRADIEYLLGEIYLRYTIKPVNEKVRDMISSRVTLVVILGLALIQIPIIFSAMGLPQSKPATLALVLFVGAMGGLLSMQQRYQKVSREGDPIDNITVLMQGWARIFLPALNGSIFALLLYMLIMGELVQGNLFPKIINMPGKSGVGFMDLIDAGRPATTGDYSKLIVWCFLAGFAERLVPDTLSRFVIKKAEEKEAK